MRRLRERLTFANVTASLALFIALGGTSYAAITLPRNSVGWTQMRSNAIRSAEIADRSIGARDLTLGARRYLKGQKGEQGARGPAGPAGGTGQAGERGGTTGTSAAGVTTTTVTKTVPIGAATGDPDDLTTTTAEDSVACSSGRATGGGVRVASSANQFVIGSFPVGGTAWQAVVGNDAGSDSTFTVYVICAS